MHVNDIVTGDMKVILEETFVKHHGFFTNRGTSLFETLESISAEQASVRHGMDHETIAGHVFHMKFYLAVAMDSMTLVSTAPADWGKSWIVFHVTDTEWKDLKRMLKSEYERTVSFIDNVQDWSAPDVLAGVLGIVAHNAFHLGAIRELCSGVKLK